MKPTSLVLLCAIFAVRESEGYGGTIRQGKRMKLSKKVTISELYIYNDIIHVAVALEIVLGNITYSVSNMEGRSSLVCCGTTNNGIQLRESLNCMFPPS